MPYSQMVLDHFARPRLAGAFSATEQGVLTEMVRGPGARDVVKLQLKINTRGVIEDVRWKAYGGVCTIAVLSLLAESIKGITANDALRISPAQMVQALALPPDRLYCADLAVQALLAALAGRLTCQVS